MQNNSEQYQKSRLLKSLAILGFVGLIIVISWLGIQLVKVLPNAFSSLASLADSVYSYEPTKITVANNKVSVTTKESLTVSWNAPKQAGSFAFSYQCNEGLTLDMKDSLGNTKALLCDTNYNVGSVTAIELMMQTTKDRFTDLKYRIDFIPSGKEEPTTGSNGSIVITNPDITEGGMVAEKPDVDPVVVATSTPVISEVKPATTTPVVKPVAPKPVYVQKPVYAIPTSNPSGFTDLAVNFIGSGSISGGVFKNTAIIDNDTTGAIQFAIQNIGTKTSNEWTYTAKLPNGETYTSPKQAALKPNERAVITLGFALDGMTGVKKYSAAISITPDANTKNNQFNTVVAVTD
jgi:hypothetical protein